LLLFAGGAHFDGATTVLRR